LKTLIANQASRVTKNYPDAEESPYSSNNNPCEVLNGYADFDSPSEICVIAKGFFIVGSTGAKISYEVDDDEFSEEKEGIGAISTVDSSHALNYRKYRIRFENYVDYVELYEVAQVSYKDGEKEQKIYAVLKKEFEARLTSIYKKSDELVNTKKVVINYFNPNKAMLVVLNEKNSIVGGKYRSYSNGFNDIFYEVYNDIKFQSTSKI